MKTTFRRFRQLSPRIQRTTSVETLALKYEKQVQKDLQPLVDAWNERDMDEMERLLVGKTVHPFLVKLIHLNDLLMSLYLTQKTETIMAVLELIKQLQETEDVAISVTPESHFKRLWTTYLVLQDDLPMLQKAMELNFEIHSESGLGGTLIEVALAIGNCEIATYLWSIGARPSLAQFHKIREFHSMFPTLGTQCRPILETITTEYIDLIA